MNIRARYAIMKMNSTTNGDFVMPVSYDKLWKMLIDKKMNRTDLKDGLVSALMFWPKWDGTSLFQWKACIKSATPYLVI